MRGEAKFMIVMIMTGILTLPVLTPLAASEDNREVKIKVESLTPLGTTMEEKSIKVGDAKELASQMQMAEKAFKIAMNSDSNESEKRWAINLIENLVSRLKALGIIPAGFVFKLPNFLSPKFALMVPVLSVGTGFSYIPFYPGEAFIGFMLRPIFLQYFLFGYTASLNVKLVPPRIEYWDMVGTHTAIILGFVGIYIDFGQIGYGVPNIQFLLGESLFTTGIDWL